MRVIVVRSVLITVVATEVGSIRYVVLPRTLTIDETSRKVDIVRHCGASSSQRIRIQVIVVYV